MTRRYLKYSILLLAFLSFPVKPVSAIPLRLLDEGIYSLGSFSNNGLKVKGNQSYDEKKDPALRRGTENWEQSQGGYFVVPGIVIGIIGLFLFFNRGKSD